MNYLQPIRTIPRNACYAKQGITTAATGTVHARKGTPSVSTAVVHAAAKARIVKVDRSCGALDAGIHGGVAGGQIHHLRQSLLIRSSGNTANAGTAADAHVAKIQHGIRRHGRFPQGFGKVIEGLVAHGTSYMVPWTVAEFRKTDAVVLHAHVHARVLVAAAHTLVAAVAADAIVTPAFGSFGNRKTGQAGGQGVARLFKGDIHIGVCLISIDGYSVWDPGFCFWGW